MRISDRVRRLTPSLTLALIAKTKALKAQGRDIVSLNFVKNIRIEGGDSFYGRCERRPTTNRF